MRPVIKHDIAIYAPEVCLEMKEAKKICELLISNSATIRSLAIRAVYFSFKHITQFDEGATILVAKALLAMQNKVSIAVAFVDYNDAQFLKLKSLFPNKSLPLFRTEYMANLLLGLKLKSPPLHQSIIYYDVDGMVQTIISRELAAKGYDVICVNSDKEFANKRRQYLDNAIYLYDIYFDVTNNFIPITIKNGIVTYTLYKKADKSISLFFNIQAHNARLRDGYKVFIFDASETKDFNVSVIDFIMSLALNNTKFEACIAICGLKTPLHHDKQQLCARSNISFFESVNKCVNDPKIKELAKAHQVAANKTRGLTKHLVAQLPVFVNAAIETLSSLTGGDARRTDYKVTKYSKSNQPDIMGATIAFEGDVNGIVALCFSKAIVKEASKMLLGEESQNDEELLDVISEFTNIIAGRSKAVLAESDIFIGISLPTAFKNEEGIARTLAEKQGVQINLLLNNKSLVLFLAH